MKKLSLRNLMKERKKKGFTLVELIIVIAIIAILVALAIPKFGQVIENSNQKADQATAKNIASAVAQEIASGTPGFDAGAHVEVTSENAIASKLDGNISAKSKKAGSKKTFTYDIDSTGNITVNYTDGKQVYPKYDADAVNSTPPKQPAKQ